MSETKQRSYFVDEAGDPILFNRRRQIVVGTEGCSSHFVLGLLDVADPTALAAELDALRARLLADPYFRNVPSMQVEAKKTALQFHAKDDLPEVRREVFAILLRHELRFFAVVRDKQKVVSYVRQQNERRSEYRYNQNELYDALTRRLFRDRLHQDDRYSVCFARRGRSDRTTALQDSLDGARRNFARKWGIERAAVIDVVPGNPEDFAGLQAVDYFLWALQRAYERREDRFIRLVWPKVSLVHDIDDTRTAKYGRYYTRNNPLTVTSLPAPAV
ncbi:MAG: DUF3800 domain-containing protein [Phycisphaerae bacterium]